MRDRYTDLFILVIMASVGYLFLNPDITIIALIIVILLNQLDPL